MNDGIGVSSPSPCPAATANGLFYWSGLALIGGAIVSGLIEPLLTLTRYIPHDPNEGWNAFFSEVAMRGGDLYPAAGGTIVNNYPPLSFYVVGVIGRLMGDNIFAGRTVALLSMLIVSGNIYLWLRVSGSARRVAWLGAAVFAAFAVTYARTYAGMDDPQYLAHAIMTTGMVVLWRGNASTRAIGFGSLLVFAGGCTKHLLIPLPIAITWWLWRRSKSAFTAWLVCGVFLLAATGILLLSLYGAAFFENLFSARQYSFPHALVQIRRALKCFAPVIALSLLIVPLAHRSERTQFAVAYLLSAALVAAIASGGIGVGINAFFDFAIAISLCTALAAEAYWTRRLPGPLRMIEFGPAATLLLGIYLGAYASSLFPKTLSDLGKLEALENDTFHDTATIAGMAQGRVACEALELCYWAKRESAVDFFNYGQRLKVGRQPTAPCASVFDGKYISILQLDSQIGRPSMQLPQGCNDLIQRNYRTISVSAHSALLESIPGK
jgi:hypothetical protein